MSDYMEQAKVAGREAQFDPRMLSDGDQFATWEVVDRIVDAAAAVIVPAVRAEAEAPLEAKLAKVRALCERVWLDSGLAATILAILDGESSHE